MPSGRVPLDQFFTCVKIGWMRMRVGPNMTTSALSRSMGLEAQPAAAIQISMQNEANQRMAAEVKGLRRGGQIRHDRVARRKARSCDGCACQAQIFS